MTYVLVRHKVADFSKWKAEYDAHLPTRQKAGLEEEHLLRNIDNPDEVVLLFEAENLHDAQAFARSSDLREAMQKAGVVDKPDIYFLATVHGSVRHSPSALQRLITQRNA